MATYEEIYGKRVEVLDADPTLTAAYEGQVWYNSTSGKLKTVLTTAAWSSSSGLISARYTGTGFGVTTAAVYAAGADPSGATNSTFEYNGSGWSSGGNVNTARYELGGTTAGIETAGLIFGGHTGPPGFNGTQATEEYNGTAWTSVNNMATTVSFMGGSGIQTAAFSAGGRTPSNTNNSQEYDGTNWSNGNNINTTRQSLVGMGTQTAGIIAGGEAPGGGSNSTETYDGTNWTAAPNLGTARYRLSGSGSVSTASLVFGGRFNPPAADKAQTESFDGTSWTEKADLATARQQLSGNRGTSSSAIAAGGLPPPANATTATEEWNVSVNTITAAAWTAGGSVSTVRTNVGSTSNGTQNAALVWGGRTGPPPSGPYTSNKCDEYDGTSFTATPNLNLAARTREGGGTTSAAWCAGGETPYVQSACEEYNGSSWTTVTAAPLVFQGCGTGVQTAGLIAGLVSASPPTGSDAFPGISLEYDGTNWATGGSPNNDRRRGGCSGTQTAGTLISGYSNPPSPSPGTRLTDIEEYNGSSWTSGGSVVTANAEINAGARGPQTATLITGGFQNPSPGAGSTQCSNYDGTATATTASLGTGRRGHGSDGGQTSGLAMTGQSAAPPVNSPGNYTANAEALTAETIAINAKTLTTG